MSYKLRSYTNPTLRKLYRATKRVAQNAEVGHNIMCPCGCLNTFIKKEKNQIFSPVNDGLNHKDTYYNRVRSRSNYAFDDKMLIIRSKMNNYLIKNKDLLKKLNQSNKINQEIKITQPENLFNSENFIELMKQNKNLNATKKVGDSIMCPCGCAEKTTKRTYQQVYAQSEIMNHKDNYYNKIKGITAIENTELNKKIFDVMTKNLMNELSEQKNKSKNKLKIK